MSDQFGAPAIPAAWYTDPGDARQLRYWDGRGWTSQVAPKPTPPPAPQAPAPIPPPLAQPQQPPQPQPREQPPVDFGNLFDDSAPSMSYVPLSRTDASADRRVIQSAASPNTSFGWLYALAPIVVIPLALLPVPVDLLNAADLPLRAGLVLLFIILVIVIAAIDRHQLRSREYNRTPPAILGLLPPVFSIARTVGVGARGLVLALLSLALQATVVFLLVANLAPAPVTTPEIAATSDQLSAVGLVAPFTDEQKAALLTPAGMELKLKYDAQSSAQAYEAVQCEPLASTHLGVQTVCTAESKLAHFDIYVQVLPAADGVPFTVISVSPSLDF